MKKPNFKVIEPRSYAFKIASIYILFSIIWIIVSDEIFFNIISSPNPLTLIGSLKGCFFVLITTILIFALVYHYLASIKESEERFIKAFDSNPIAIVLSKPGGEIVDVNKSYLDLTGFSEDELYGKTFLELNIISKKACENLMEEFNEKGIVHDYKTEINTKSGLKRTVLATIEPILIAGKKHNLNYLYDITEREKAEKKLKTSLNEKESLLREVHHRVNNNLQIITSLLNLQSHYVSDDSRETLLVSQSRIKSMAMIYEKLYKSPDLGCIPLKDYIENFVSDLFYLYQVDRDLIKVKTDLEKVKIGIETAVPLGLIINELIINILKHAFPDKTGGKIDIGLRTSGEYYILTIADNGIGLPPDILKKRESLGLNLVENLVEQLEGQMEITRMKGTKFSITFKEIEYANRI